VYREGVSEFERALRDPTQAKQDRGIGRALAFTREHAGESVSVAQVARVAGFAPDYFSRLFRREQGVTFRKYLQDLRLERAKQMLGDTALSVDQIQKLAGFRTRTHFHAAFKHAVGCTPIEFRRRENDA
jgi:two-component system response regulator YesN